MSFKSKDADVSAVLSPDSGIWEFSKVVIQALIIAAIVRTFLFQPFNIPSGSLIPTLLIGDYLFVSKYSYGYSKFSIPFGFNLFSGRILGSSPKRGDVAVFKLPLDTSQDYIKRVIGLPGDHIKLINARLFINGEMVPREPTQKITTRDQFGNDVEVPTYKETLPGGVTHLIIQRDGDNGFYSNTQGEFEVPPGHYFMMGDNRDNSTDSRVPPEQGGVGYVPFENFVGRAEVIFFSLKEDTSIFQVWKWPEGIRWNRIFQPVR